MKFLLSGIFHTGSSRRFTVAISRPNSFFQSLRTTRQRLECAASRRFSSIAGKSPPFFTQALHAASTLANQPALTELFRNHRVLHFHGVEQVIGVHRRPLHTTSTCCTICLLCIGKRVVLTHSA